MPPDSRVTVRRTDALDLLAEASGLLASSFELETTLPLVADLCVRRFADYCSISARQGDVAPRIVQACRDDDAAAMLEQGPALPEMLRRSGFETVVVAPICGRKEILGTFVLAAREKSAFNGQTQKLATVLALQIANALDQATLFERTQRVADRLQRALLPATFPTVPGASFDGAYRPASDEAEVGGDWYDAFELPDGRVAISMGDVAGHGLEAATVMGEIRQTMRTVALREQSPASLLDHVNGVINLRAGIGMVTAIFGYYTPDTRTLTYAVAGHPPPAIIIANGFSGFLPGGGVPLGVAAAVNARDWTITLPPRSCVLFYTDGMIEYSRDVVLGEERLLDEAVASYARALPHPALALQERIFESTINRDDAATLTLSCDSGPTPRTILFSALPLCAPIVRSILHRFCDEHDLSVDQRFSVITAVGEAVANAVEHAYRGEEPGLVEIHTAVTADVITIQVEDHGRWRPSQKRDERGRGIVLMHELMEHVRITSARDHTQITMTLARASEKPAV